MKRLIFTTIAMLAALLQPYLARAASFQPYPIGTIVRDVLEVGNGVRVPLPEGDWVVVSDAIHANNGGTRFYHPVLVDAKDRVLQRVIMIDSALEGPRLGNFGNGYVFNKECRRQDVQYVKEIINLDGGKQDCWGVNHFVMGLSANPGKEYVDRNNYLRDHGIPVPGTVIAVAYHFADNSTHYLDVRYYNNPEVAGFAPSKTTTWKENDWHKVRSYVDPKKKVYIDQLIAWGESFHDRVKAGFEGKLQASVPYAASSQAPNK